MSSRSSRPTIVPSRTHEARRVLLETVADIAGYRLELCLPDGKRPDVLRLHINRQDLFVGEAKHAEGPDDLNSIDRLRHYLGWLFPLYERGVGSILAVAHPSGLERAWRDRIGWLCWDLRLAGTTRSASATPGTTVTFAVFGAVDPRHDLPSITKTRHGRHGAPRAYDTRRGRGRLRSYRS